MKVKLDLRPRSLVKAQRKRVNAARVLLVSLFLAFLLVGGVTLGLSFLKARGMKAEVAMLNDQVAIQQAQNLKMSNEIKRLAEVEAVYVSALNLLQEELPALEFLNSIETSLPLGVWISSVTISPGKAIIKGNSYVENDVVEFAKGLLDAGVAATVDFPVTARITKDKESLVDFTLSCVLRDLADLSSPGRAQGGGI
ncbi:MAG: PilN domain-containing protein [Synergistaceae bacterium]|jgi:cell division protein FtsL|nr:PilN domain-containing protein [Synergistaceae bacterium]